MVLAEINHRRAYTTCKTVNKLARVRFSNLHLNHVVPERPGGGGGGGVLEVYMTGGPTYFFGLKIYTLGIFLGQEICHVFF